MTKADDDAKSDQELIDKNNKLGLPAYRQLNPSEEKSNRKDLSSFLKDDRYWEGR